jgi:Fe-S-cluster-containing dehydrogenase component
VTARLTFVLDLDRCIGCWACAVACRMKNELPEGVWWIRVETIGGTARDTSAGVFPDVSKHYMPLIDRCACTAEDLNDGAMPACAQACPTQVFSFGDAGDPEGAVGRLVSGGNTFAVGERRGNEPEVRYLPARKAVRQRRSGGR